MSTSAAIFFRNENGTYTGTEVTNDGYIQLERFRNHVCPGVGHILAKYWNDKDEIKNLCYGPAVENLDENIADSTFHNYRQTGLDNLQFKDVMKCGYDYIYMFDADGWSVVRHNNGMLLSLNCFIDFDDPERFRDDDEFWK